MNITVELDETLVYDAVRRAWAQTLSAPTYSSDRGSDGYEAIRRQVRQYIMATDFTAQIQETALRLLPATVEDVVGAELQRWIKAEVKRQRTAGIFAAETE